MQHIYQQIQGWFDFEDLYNYIIDKLSNNFVFAEIGVWKGQSLSYFVVESLNQNKLGTIYAVDHWQGSPEHLSPTSPFYEPLLIDNPDGLFDHFINNIKPIQDYITIIKKPSSEAAQDIPNNFLDAIFIEANHSYDAVTTDLNLWMPKLKNNGIFCGHDYSWGSVKSAVHDFAQSNKLSINGISQRSWILQPR